LTKSWRAKAGANFPRNFLAPQEAIGMDHSIALMSHDRQRAVERLASHVAASIDTSHADQMPFEHIVLDRVFPDEVYAAMLAAMPLSSAYRPMAGRAAGNDLADGTHTRVKLDLFPEMLRNLDLERRNLWQIVGDALCSGTVKDALVRRLAPVLQRRFGPGYAKVGMYPLPTLTRDVPGYWIVAHADTHWKGITVQFYLPADDKSSHIGTIFHELMPDGSRPKRVQMKFLPNSGYAFAVDTTFVHSVDTLGPEVKSRDSILLTYFVDQSPMRYLRNRGKRIGNFLLNELRNRTRRQIGESA